MNSVTFNDEIKTGKAQEASFDSGPLAIRVCSRHGKALGLASMKVLFCCDDTRPEPWLKGLHDALPGAEIAIWEPGAPQADYALVWAPPQQFLDEQAAGLKAMFNIGAGVDACCRCAFPPSCPSTASKMRAWPCRWPSMWPRP
jgi:hypothetical protein